MGMTRNLGLSALLISLAAFAGGSLRADDDEIQWLGDYQEGVRQVVRIPAGIVALQAPVDAGYEQYECAPPPVESPACRSAAWGAGAQP